MPFAGGAPQLILETKTGFLNFDCPLRPGTQCVAGEESSDLQRWIFSSFDPGSGAPRHLFGITASAEKPLSWTVSPDGSRIAMIGSDPQGGIEIRLLTGQIENRIEVKGWPNPLTVDWAADGKTLFVSHAGLMQSPSGLIGATLLRVGFEGHAQPLWETRGGRYTWGIASPDGKYLAIRGAATERNAWMIENF